MSHTAINRTANFNLPLQGLHSGVFLFTAVFVLTLRFLYGASCVPSVPVPRPTLRSKFEWQWPSFSDVLLPAALFHVPLWPSRCSIKPIVYYIIHKRRLKSRSLHTRIDILEQKREKNHFFSSSFFTKTTAVHPLQNQQANEVKRAWLKSYIFVEFKRALYARFHFRFQVIYCKQKVINQVELNPFYWFCRPS